jgi:hypothetical protein
MRNPDSETEELVISTMADLDSQANISELSFFVPLLGHENLTQEHSAQKHLASYIVPG